MQFERSPHQGRGLKGEHSPRMRTFDRQNVPLLVCALSGAAVFERRGPGEPGSVLKRYMLCA